MFGEITLTGAKLIARTKNDLRDTEERCRGAFSRGGAPNQEVGASQPWEAIDAGAWAFSSHAISSCSVANQHVETFSSRRHEEERRAWLANQ